MSPTEPKHTLALLLAVAMAGFTGGCYTATRNVTLSPARVPDPPERRGGHLSIKFSDKRVDKTKVGHIAGGIFRQHPDLVLSGELETTLTEIFEKTLEQAGYAVISGGPPTLECEIREFWVHGNGWIQGATQKIRVRLSDKEGQILWEHTFKGEDGGIDMAVAFAEKSMNVALTRLLTDAIEEFSSEFFYQSVRKAAEGTKITDPK